MWDCTGINAHRRREPMSILADQGTHHRGSFENPCHHARIVTEAFFRRHIQDVDCAEFGKRGCSSTLLG